MHPYIYKYRYTNNLHDYSCRGYCVFYLLGSIPHPTTHVYRVLRLWLEICQWTYLPLRKIRVLFPSIVRVYVCSYQKAQLYIHFFCIFQINEKLYYVTGCFYYFSSTVNPILYNLLSVKYRYGYMCINLN